MAFVDDVRTPTSVPRILITLQDRPADSPQYSSEVHIQVYDQNDEELRTVSSDLTDHYTAQELQPLRDFLIQLRADIEAAILP